MTISVKRILATLLATLVVFVTTAIYSYGAPYRTYHKTIRFDRGGYVLQYALAMKKLERSRGRVRFAGRCDSACTIYLGLPKSQLCATPASAFGFHLPYGGSARANKMAKNYMLRSYPSWVRSWLNANGGLTTRIKVMRYADVRGHLPQCAT